MTTRFVVLLVLALAVLLCMMGCQPKTEQANTPAPTTSQPTTGQGGAPAAGTRTSPGELPPPQGFQGGGAQPSGK